MLPLVAGTGCSAAREDATAGGTGRRRGCRAQGSGMTAGLGGGTVEPHNLG